MYKNNLIAVKTTSVSMFKHFCYCNAAASDLYDIKSKNKIAVIFFS